MKILIANDGPFAHKYIRLGLARAFSACGHEAIIWELGQKSAFDMFDEFEPEIFYCPTYHLTDDIIKCLKERPYTKVACKASDWGIAQKDMDLNEYPILVANQKEIDTVLKLKDEIGKPDFVDIHYHQSSVNLTHSYWIDNGIKAIGLLSAADINDYIHGVSKPELECDIAFVGGYWPYKSKTLNKWLIPLCHPKENYKIKIFGNQPWGVPQYCGFIPTEEMRNLFASAKICPSISEPHSQVYGHDIIERPFKLLSCKAFVISDYVKSMEDNVFGDNLLYAKTPEEFKEKINFYLKNLDLRQEYIDKGYQHVINHHTYFHRAAQFFDALDLPYEAQNCLRIYGKIKETL